MILPPQSATTMPSSCPRPRGSGPGGGGGGRPVVQWRRRHVREGLLVVDQAQLAKLVKREPITSLYKLDPEPFATGQFASVWRCRSLETGQVFAAKFSSRTRYGEDCSAEIRHEIALLSLCAPSPRVVRLHDVFETPKEIIIVLEYAPGGDLQTIIDDNLVPFESDVIKFVRQLLEGLVYLHERRIAHLDIKPQNLVMMSQFPDCDVKLCDFEISRVIVEGTEIRELLGTPDYVAPEILHYEPITLAADMWSLGVTTYVLLTGFSPFGGETDQETFCNISGAQLDFPEELFEDVSEAAQDFIRRLLVRDPRARPTAKECLRHRWFAGSKAKTKPKDAGGLRKYLSKSREALFERVVQQQSSCHDLRRKTLLTQQRRRLCESHASLLVSRQRALTDQYAPALSRSREKLYGLRSLSRSQEALRGSNRSLLNLCAAIDADTTNFSDESPSGRSSAPLDNDTASQTTDVNSNSQPNIDVFPATTNSSDESNSTGTDISNRNVEHVADPLPDNANTSTTVTLSNNELSSPAILKRCMNLATKSDAFCHPSITYDHEDEPVRTSNPTITISDTVGENGTTEEDATHASYSSSSDGEEGSSASGSGSSHEGEEAEEAEGPLEPRFTVAQLVSAFNRHEEAVTRAVPAAVPLPGSRFPTGPNALRLFIPDISIRSKKQHHRRSSRAGQQRQQPPVREEHKKSPDVSTKDLEPPATNGDQRLHADAVLEEEESSEKMEGSVRLMEAPCETFTRQSSHDTNNNSSTNNGCSSSWERICTGSYTRAIDKFRPTRKSLTAISSPPVDTIEKVRRKSNPAIKNCYL